MKSAAMTSLSTDHTFLFCEGLWVAEGLCTDQYGESRPCTGKTRITHAETAWALEGVMTLPGDPAQEFRNQYEVAPFEPNEDSTTWRSVNPAIGLLHGVFAVVGDSILSRFISACGNFIGVEAMRLVSPTEYTVRGALFYRDERLSSWAMELRRIEGGDSGPFSVES